MCVAHIGVDARNAIVHSVWTMATPLSGMHMLPDSVAWAEHRMWGNAGY